MFNFSKKFFLFLLFLSLILVLIIISFNVNFMDFPFSSIFDIDFNMNFIEENNNNIIIVPQYNNILLLKEDWIAKFLYGTHTIPTPAPPTYRLNRAILEILVYFFYIMIASIIIG